MSNIFNTTAIGYATRGNSDDPSSTGYAISREPLSVRWDKVLAILAIENPARFFDNETVTEAVSMLETDGRTYHICCAHAEALRLWQQWEARPKPYHLAVS